MRAFAARSTSQGQPGRRSAPGSDLLAAVGNRGLATLAAAPPPAGARGMAPALRQLTSPANDEPAADPLTADPTTPGTAPNADWAIDPDPTTPTTGPAGTEAAVENPSSLTIKGSGAIEGSYGISQYWPVTNYWGADKTLGAFDQASTGDWHMSGHKFQVVGEFTNGKTTTGGGKVTFVQQARLTNTKGGTPGAWFDDMNYTDAANAVHAWDPNTENGATGAGGNPGVGRTLSTTKRAYTDPPAISYKPKVGTTAGTSTYRKLEFKIQLVAPPGSSAATITRYATQEIEVVDGVVTVHQAP